MKTIKDVAGLAGVSTATVSNVLSGKRFVSQELIERVKQAIIDLDYRPSGVAKSLKTKRTFTIGVIVSAIQNPYFAAVVTGISDFCFKKRYGVVLGESYESPRREAHNINLLMEKRVDGFIIAPVGADQKELDLLMKSNIPFVLINRTFPHSDNWNVIVNNEGASYKATRYLLELGHRSIGIICGPRKYSTSLQRLKGYCRALEEAKIPMRDKLVRFSKLDINTSYEKTLELLAQRPTAVFATNNVLNAGALWALRERKIKIPHELSLITLTFDESPWPRIVNPTLTIVSQPSYQVGLEGAKMLFAQLKGAPYRKQIILETKFTVGESTGPPPNLDSGNMALRASERLFGRGTP
jgi:LacI family transcriptional regulator